jgi:para-nitrobenzyl esterase
VTTDAASAPEVDTAAGRVRGSWRGSSAALLGIPFAEPPVGDLRFAAPVPARAWSGVRDATAHGPTAQRTALSEITLIPEPSIPGESTLNVDVYTPSPEIGPGLPVLVWIHGGGFVAGSPASPWYDGRSFNRDGVVTVCVSYRLGFDGFGWIEGAPSNRAVRDWLLALEWVRTNVAAFGGDPSRVTIAGQSAGGGAALTLLGMEAAQHLFARVYSLSGAIADVPEAKARGLAQRLAERAGVEPTLDGFRSVPEGRLLELQDGLSASDESDGSDDAEDPLARLAALEDGLTFGPVLDGDLLHRPTLESFRLGVGADKELVAGATEDEFPIGLDETARVLDGLPASAVLARVGLSETAIDAYLDAHQGFPTSRVVQDLLTDRVFRSLALAAADARPDGRTWLYRFGFVSPTMHAAIHCIDVPFWFDCLAADRVTALTGPEPPQSLADEVHGAAVRFVATGRPGWPAHSRARGEVMRFGDPSRVVDDGYRDVRPLLG